MEKENIKKEDSTKESMKEEIKTQKEIQKKPKEVKETSPEPKGEVPTEIVGKKPAAEEAERPAPYKVAKEVPTDVGITRRVKKEKKEKVRGKEKPSIKKFRTIITARPKKPERIEEKKEFEEKVLEIKRVARVVKGGRRFKFRAAVVVGNRDGKVGIGIGKGSEVTGAVSKAVARAKKNMFEIKLVGRTIPFDIKSSFKGALVLLKPARKGTGIIAGGAVRAVVESAGISDISSKMLGSANKISNMIATFQALKKFSKIKR